MKLYKGKNASFRAVLLTNGRSVELKIKIKSEKSNPLLRRKEVDFELDHSEEGRTSSRLELKEKLADRLKVKPDLLFVEKFETKTGTTLAQGQANIYESAEQAKLVEREHIIARNSPPAEPEKDKSEEPAKKEQMKEGANKIDTKKEGKPEAPKEKEGKPEAPKEKEEGTE